MITEELSLRVRCLAAILIVLGVAGCLASANKTVRIQIVQTGSGLAAFRTHVVNPFPFIAFFAVVEPSQYADRRFTVTCMRSNSVFGPLYMPAPRYEVSISERFLDNLGNEPATTHEIRETELRVIRRIDEHSEPEGNRLR